MISSSAAFAFLNNVSKNQSSSSRSSRRHDHAQRSVSTTTPCTSICTFNDVHVPPSFRQQEQELELQHHGLEENYGAAIANGGSTTSSTTRNNFLAMMETNDDYRCSGPLVGTSHGSPSGSINAGMVEAATQAPFDPAQRQVHGRSSFDHASWAASAATNDNMNKKQQQQLQQLQFLQQQQEQLQQQQRRLQQERLSHHQEQLHKQLLGSINKNNVRGNGHDEGGTFEILEHVSNMIDTAYEVCNEASSRTSTTSTASHYHGWPHHHLMAGAPENKDSTVITSGGLGDESSDDSLWDFSSWLEPTPIGSQHDLDISPASLLRDGSGSGATNGDVAAASLARNNDTSKAARQRRPDHVVLSEFLGLLSSYQATRMQQEQPKQGEQELPTNQGRDGLEGGNPFFDRNYAEEEFTVPPSSIAADFCNFGSFPSNEEPTPQPSSPMRTVRGKSAGVTTKTNHKKRPALDASTAATITPDRSRHQRRRIDATTGTSANANAHEAGAGDVDYASISSSLDLSPMLGRPSSAGQVAALGLPSPLPAEQLSYGDDDDDDDDEANTKAAVTVPSTGDDEIDNIGSDAAGSDNRQRFRYYQEEQWFDRFQDMLHYKKTQGHCNVPNIYPPNPHLAQWVKRQRYQHKLKQEGRHSTLTDSRQESLDEIGFVWDSHHVAWMERWQELADFRAEHGHANVPTNYGPNRQLSIWVKCQRRQYKLFFRDDGARSNMTPARIQKMESLGFVWDPRGAKQELKRKLKQAKEQQQKQQQQQEKK